MRLPIDNREAVLQAYLERIEKNDVPADLKSHLRVYGVVQICGYIERCMEIIIIERLQSRAHPRIVEFIKSQFKFGTNFKCPAIKSFLERFDVGWAKKFQDFINANEDVEEGINSAYAIRNQASHGNSTNIGPQRVAEVLDLAKRAIQAVIEATA